MYGIAADRAAGGARIRDGQLMEVGAGHTRYCKETGATRKWDYSITGDK
jgi:hypothetical protein